MNTVAKHFVLAFLLLVLVVVSAPLVPRHEQVSVLGAGAALGEVVEPELRLLLPKQSLELPVSSQAEVLFFNLEAQAPYSLRYLTVAVDASGVKLPAKVGDWKVYEVENGHTQFSRQVGYGEVWDGNLLRLRFYSEPALAYFGQEGVARFALVAPIFTEGEGERALRFSFPDEVSAKTSWEFAVGTRFEPWFGIPSEDILDSSSVSELPSEALEKN